MDKAEETQDTEVEAKDETLETGTKTPDEKKPAPKKTPKVYTEDDLRERGRDNATLTQRRKELDERETRVREAEEKAKWNPVIEKYGQEKADKIKEAGLTPDQIGSIADLLDVKAPPNVQKVDPGTTEGGLSRTFQDIESGYIAGKISEPEYREARKKRGI